MKNEITKLMNEGFLNLNEETNAYDSLEKFSFFLEKTKEDPTFWKWAIVALHNTLYGLMILVLKGTTSLNVINPKKTKKILLWKRVYSLMILVLKGTNPLNIIKNKSKHIIYFQEAFKRIQKKQFTQTGLGKGIPFNAEKKHKDSVKRLNSELRNRFMHFIPGVWGIEINLLRKITKDCMEIIEYCLFKSGNIAMHDTCGRSTKQDWETLIQKIKALL